MKMRVCANCGSRFPNNVDRCPECSTHVQRATRTGDRYVEVPGKGGTHVSFFVPGRSCEWDAGGRRCRYPATMSLSADGSGPWYCSWHHGNRDPIMGADIVWASADWPDPPEGRGMHPDAAAVLDRVQHQTSTSAAAYCKARKLTTQAEMATFSRSHLRSIGKREKSVAWAHKILAALADGKPVAMIAEQKARAALGETATAVNREPGEEG